MNMFPVSGTDRPLVLNGGVGGNGGNATGTGGVGGAGGNGEGPQLTVEATENLFVDVRGDLHFSTVTPWDRLRASPQRVSGAVSSRRIPDASLGPNHPRRSSNSHNSIASSMATGGQNTRTEGSRTEAMGNYPHSNISDRLPFLIEPDPRPFLLKNSTPDLLEHPLLDFDTTFTVEDRVRNNNHPYPEYSQSGPVYAGAFIHAQNVHPSGETGINILHRSVSVDALHDSVDSFPQPKCHPETRQKLLDKLWTHVTALEHPNQIVWLYGPAGAGKSAMMWSLCERLEKSERLGGTFFFKRGHPTRGNARALFSTIAYRLALRIPWLKAPITGAVEHDPSLVTGTPEIQFWRLILGPCQSAPSKKNPAIIIIDGLDECDDLQMQQEILRVLQNFLPQYSSLLRIVVASRPEAHIRQITQGAYHGLGGGAYQGLNVEQSFVDVRKYLLDEFARIHRTHPETMTSISLPWPSHEDVETLVWKSSGHFIYPSTIIKFVDDHNYRPTKRLAAVLGNLDNVDFESPFGALDQIYTQILRSVPKNPRLLDILCFVSYFPHQCSSNEIDKVFELESGDTELALRGLHSLVAFDQATAVLGWHHASFGDFLQSSERAGSFYVGALSATDHVVRYVLKALSRENEFGPVAWKLRGWIGYIILLPPSSELLSLIRQMNPVFVLEYSMNDITELIAWFRLLWI
ncbi:hypothetical protein B0H16DRAFT_1790182 [Mycena metata]|uniref:Nephrocystin 3-like N-terminal domain-containing protein n=1 Tax=Mycena metata TaxID=1033252 RepID=A0AAD7MKQ0_9AGAR|nr:hypothetical protein B0H16DRAFT_1790182 [Mycena metata]